MCTDELLCTAACAYLPCSLSSSSPGVITLLILLGSFSLCLSLSLHVILFSILSLHLSIYFTYHRFCLLFSVLNYPSVLVCMYLFTCLSVCVCVCFFVCLFCLSLALSSFLQSAKPSLFPHTAALHVTRKHAAGFSRPWKGLLRGKKCLIIVSIRELRDAKTTSLVFLFFVFFFPRLPPLVDHPTHDCTSRGDDSVLLTGT